MVFEVPQLNSCFCFPLKTGAIIVGLSQLILCLMYNVDVTIMLIRLELQEPQIKYYNLLGDLLFDHAEILQTLFSVILLIGLYRDNSSFVMAWILNMITILADTVWNTLLMSYMYFHISYVIEMVLILGFELGISWLVFSYYRTMTKSNYAL